MTATDTGTGAEALFYRCYVRTAKSQAVGRAKRRARLHLPHIMVHLPHIMVVKTK
jgi:hypothetical protein